MGWSGRSFIPRVIVLSGIGNSIVSERGGKFGSSKLVVLVLLLVEFVDGRDKMSPGRVGVGIAKVAAKY